jgi:hypothetical protein
MNPGTEVLEINPKSENMPPLFSPIVQNPCGYDKTSVYSTLDERHPNAVIVVPPHVDAVLSATADIEPTFRRCRVSRWDAGQ